MKLESYTVVGRVAIVLAVVVAVFFAVMAVDAATTISTDVVTGGSINASSTVAIGGLSTLAGFISTASSTIDGDFNVGGALTASSTFMVDGIATFAASGAFTGGLTRQNEIWTYNSSGIIVATSTLPLGVNGTTTPGLGFALGIDGDIIASTTETTTATTTLFLHTDGSTT